MLDVTVKKLDGRNHSYSVPDDITVRQFKDHIAASIEIGAEVQRLIYRGQVLADDRKINDYDVNGKTIHVVQRAPPPINQPGGSGADPAGARQHTERHQHGGAGRNNGQAPPRPTFTFGGGNGVQNLVAQMLTGMGDLGRNAHVTTHSNPDGSSLDVHINVDATPEARGGAAGPRTTESGSRLTSVRNMMTSAQQALTRFENPETASSTVESTSAADPTTSQAGSSSAGGEGLYPSVSGSEVLDDSMRSDDVETQGTGSVGDGEPASTSSAATVGPTESSVHTSPPVEPAGTTSALEISTGAAGVSSSAAASSGAASSPATSTGATSSTAPSGPGAAASNPGVTELADIMDDVLSLNDRVRPYLTQYQQLLREDARVEHSDPVWRQRQFEIGSELMHYLSHMYHNLSDLMVDFSSPPPRVLRANPTPVGRATAVMQQTIPVQINVAHIPLGAQQQAQMASQSSQTAGASTVEQATNTFGQSTTLGGAATGQGQAASVGSGVSAGSQTSRPATASTGTSTGAQIRIGDAGGGFMVGPRYSLG